MLKGGDVNDAYAIQSAYKKYFVKVNSYPQGHEMFKSELDSLKAISDLNIIKTTQVIELISTSSHNLLLLEYIDAGERTEKFWEQLGHQLAMVHQRSQPHFGWNSTSYIASIELAPALSQDFSTFYVKHRLEPLFKRAFDQNLLHKTDYACFDKFCKNLNEKIPNERPALIHGDLWSGNFMCNQRSEPVLIDPASCMAHREMDIAMTKLFGGFTRTFYNAYNEIYPLSKGWEARTELFQIYYLLVHVLLFGTSYTAAVKHIIRKYE